MTLSFLCVYYMSVFWVLCCVYFKPNVDFRIPSSIQVRVLILYSVQRSLIVDEHQFYMVKIKYLAKHFIHKQPPTLKHIYTEGVHILKL